MSIDILVLSADEEQRTNISAALSDMKKYIGADSIAAGSESSAADPAKYTLLVISAPLGDGFGLDAAARFVSGGGSGVIFITSAANAEKAAERVSAYPVMIIPRPVKKQLLCEAVRFSVRNHLIAEDLRDKNRELEKNLSEIKLVNRAKAVLMKYLSLSEDEAHKQLRTRSMDSRRTLAETAADIIRTYEYL